MATATQIVTFCMMMVQAYNAVGDTTYPLPCVIAHAARESAWGTSGLAKYNNLFGVKAGSKWTGGSVDIKTKEEYTPGTLSTVTATWRVYESYEDCLRDYYKLLSGKRYASVRYADDEVNYFQRLYDSGYFTSTTYVSTMQPWLDQVHAYMRGSGIEETQQETAEEVQLCGLPGIMQALCEYMAHEAIAKKYGNGEERKAALGEFYDSVQRRVNRILRA